MYENNSCYNLNKHVSLAANNLLAMTYHYFTTGHKGAFHPLHS